VRIVQLDDTLRICLAGRDGVYVVMARAFANSN
jgi:hypothetical protein